MRDDGLGRNNPCPERVVKPLPAEEAVHLPQSVLYRQVKGDHKGRPFGTPRNDKIPTIEDLNPHVGEIPAGDLAGRIAGRKHGINLEQAERVKAMSNEELLRFRIDDPMSGNLNAIRDGFSITGGHHRMNEITRRVGVGELPADTLVRILFHD